MGGKRNEAMMIHVRRYGDQSSSSLSRKERTTLLSERKKKPTRHRSLWSRYKRSSDTSSDDGSDSLSPQRRHWWEGVIVADEASFETSIGSNPSVDEGPSDEDSRPSTLFLRDDHRRREPRNSQIAKSRVVPAHSPVQVVSLPHHRSSSSYSSSSRNHNLYSLEQSKSATTKTRTHRNSPTPSHRSNSGVGVAQQQQQQQQQRLQRSGGSREQRRRELIAHYLYMEAAAAVSQTPPPSNLSPPSYAQGPRRQESYPFDYDNDGDDGIVDHSFMHDSEADGVARRRTCFPSFGRPKFFGSHTKSGSHDTSPGLPEEEEEAYDYDYYFTIGDDNNNNNNNNNNKNIIIISSSKNDIDNNKNMGAAKQSTPSGNRRGTDHHTTNPRMMHYTEDHPSSSSSSSSPVLCQCSHSSHSTNASPVAAGPPTYTWDRPDAYCFFPVDDPSYNGGYEDGNHDHQNDVPLCTWNDLRFYSSACAKHLASLDTTRELQAKCQDNRQFLHQHYVEMTESTRKECAEISPRDALEELVPQELLSLLLDSCHVEGPKDTTTPTRAGTKNMTRSKSGSKRTSHTEGVARGQEETARTTDAQPK